MVKQCGSQPGAQDKINLQGAQDNVKIMSATQNNVFGVRKWATLPPRASRIIKIKESGQEKSTHNSLTRATCDSK